MTEIGAIIAWLSGFATTYPSDNVPTDATYPYITVEPRIAFFGDGDVPVQIQVYDRTDSDAHANAFARDIVRDIGYGGKALTCDGGWVWIKRGTPPIVPITGVGGKQDWMPNDEAIKRRLINVSIEYITE